MGMGLAVGMEKGRDGLSLTQTPCSGFSSLPMQPHAGALLGSETSAHLGGHIAHHC